MIDTDLQTIVGATWQGEEIPQSEAVDAINLGYDASCMIFWVKADTIVGSENAITRTIATDDKSVTIKVYFET